MRTVAFHTLGCKVNAYETQGMKTLFENAGFFVVEFSDWADVYVINTCTVTNVSDRKSRQMINRARKQNPNAVIAAVGCYVQTGASIDADVLIGSGGKGEIVNLVNEFYQKRSPVNGLTEPGLRFESMEVEQYRNRTRANVKICDGCDSFCSYCIIPYVRGRVRSRPVEDVIAEVQRLAASHKEIVLSGIHVSNYGKDIGSSLIEVCREAAKIDGIERIRLSSIDPLAFTNEFIDQLATIPKMCPHFHISLQSGSERILKMMNRHYTPAQFLDIVQEIRRKIANTAITTDVICGFPGETLDEHRESVAFVNQLKPYMTHVFPYSKRDSTAAAKMSGHLENAEKNRRAAQMIETAAKLRSEFIAQNIGKAFPVLIEKRDNEGYCIGNTPNYITIRIPGGEELCGSIVRVELCEENVFL